MSHTLVFNCGSSSLTYKVFRDVPSSPPEVVLHGKAHRVGVKGSEPSYIENRYGGTVHKDIVPIKDHRKAAALAIEFVEKMSIPVDHVGHRFVHGGSRFTGSLFLDEKVLKALQECAPLAPIHNPIALSVIRESRKSIPLERHYITFDNAFHSTLPPRAYAYMLPKAILEKFGFRKYGFHGLSYSFVVGETARFLGADPGTLRIVACHLGTGGSSVAAILGGRSIDTSMGFSPLTGLVMGTRSGDIDPLLTVYLMAVYGYRPDDLLDFLNKKSGLLGISGFSSDINDIIRRIGGGEDNAELAVRMYVHRLKKYIGSYIAALGGIDALVFTDEIGLRNPFIREKVCDGMDWAGITLDKGLNAAAPVDRISDLRAPGSRVSILAIPTEEELVIYLGGARLFADKEATRAAH
ncbi:MAG: acetate/propionate family kinase [Acidobacteria bacterium]|nr:acetate/propionate family kinase [Acidobacteriota bacterium]